MSNAPMGEIEALAKEIVLEMIRDEACDRDNLRRALESEGLIADVTTEHEERCFIDELVVAICEIERHIERDVEPVDLEAVDAAEQMEAEQADVDDQGDDHECFPGCPHSLPLVVFGPDRIVQLLPVGAHPFILAEFVESEAGINLRIRSDGVADKAGAFEEVAKILRSRAAAGDTSAAPEPAVQNLTEDKDSTIRRFATRLARIEQAHHKRVDAHGGTFGECAECGERWPCPTFTWATQDRSPLACWDPKDDGRDEDSAPIVDEDGLDEDRAEKADADGPWKAVLHDRHGFVYRCVEVAIEELGEDEEIEISVVKGTAAPVNDQMPGSWHSSDVACRNEDVYLVDPDDPECSAGVAYERALAMAAGLNRAELAKTPTA
jgi:RNA polymerase-binding transcription factor DksA